MNDGRDGAQPDSGPVLDWPQRAGATGAVLAELRRRRRRRAERRVLLGGAVAVALAVFFVRPRIEPGPQSVSLRPAAPRAVAVSPQPEVDRPAAATDARTLVLSDGSIVELKAGAEVDVDFSPALRRVVLKRGTAYFDVAKNPARPFVVVAEGIEVRAVGTAFSVQLAAQKVEVLVAEGRVRVDRPVEEATGVPAAVQVAMMEAGETFVLDLKPDALPAPVVRAVGTEEVLARLGWRAPTVEFSATPLADVVAIVNRHASHPLVLADPALGRLQISGIMRADNTSALLRLIELELGLVAEPRADGSTLLRPAP